MPRFTATLRLACALFLVAWVLTYLPRPSYTKSLPTPISASSFSLDIIGISSYAQATFNLQYAFAAGFTLIDYNNTRYRQTHQGIIFRDNADLHHMPDYRVTYRVNEWLPDVLTLRDSKTDALLAWYIFEKDGWPGGKAAAWLATQMNVPPMKAQSTQTQASNLTNQSWKVEVVEATHLLSPEDIAHPFIPIRNCGSTIEYSPTSRENGFSEIRSKSWRLTRPAGLKGVLCFEDGVLVFAGQGSSGFEVIWLSHEGLVVGRSRFANPAAPLLSDTWLTATSIQGANLIVEQSEYLLPAPLLAPIKPKSQVRFTVPLSSIARSDA